MTASTGPGGSLAEPNVTHAQQLPREPVQSAGPQTVSAVGTPSARRPASAAAAQARPPVAGGPKARCGGQNPVVHFVCMERECLRTEFAGASHPDCLEWRKEARPRE